MKDLRLGYSFNIYLISPLSTRLEYINILFIISRFLKF